MEPYRGKDAFLGNLIGILRSTRTLLCTYSHFAVLRSGHAAAHPYPWETPRTPRNHAACEAGWVALGGLARGEFFPVRFWEMVGEMIEGILPPFFPTFLTRFSIPFRSLGFFLLPLLPCFLLSVLRELLLPLLLRLRGLVVRVRVRGVVLPLLLYGLVAVLRGWVVRGNLARRIFVCTVLPDSLIYCRNEPCFPFRGWVVLGLELFKRDLSARNGLVWSVVVFGVWRSFTVVLVRSPRSFLGWSFWWFDFVGNLIDRLFFAYRPKVSVFL